MKESPARQKGRLWETSRGRLALWVFEPGFVIIQIIGLGDKAFAEPVIAAIERGLELGPRLQIFVDTELMTAYDTYLRTSVTSVLVKHRTRVASLHMVVRSKLVAMGASVANLALGGIMTIHSEPEDFRHALDQSLARFNVTGFTPEVLSVERLRKQG